MTSVIGHVYSIDFPQQYNSWDKTDPNDLFEARTFRSEANPKVWRKEGCEERGGGWRVWPLQYSTVSN